MSAIFLAADHCRTAHTRMSSGAINIQNISLNLLHRDFQPHSSAGGIVFGCTDTHAQTKTVEKHPHMIVNRDLCEGPSVVDVDGTDPSKM